MTNLQNRTIPSVPDVELGGVTAQFPCVRWTLCQKQHDVSLTDSCSVRHTVAKRYVKVTLNNFVVMSKHIGPIATSVGQCTNKSLVKPSIYAKYHLNTWSQFQLSLAAKLLLPKADVSVHFFCSACCQHLWRYFRPSDGYYHLYKLKQIFFTDHG